MKFFALVALALVASANAAAVTSFASTTRPGTLATGATMAQAGNIVFTFRPATNLVDTNDIIITAGRAIWSATGDAGCTVDQGGAKTVTSALITAAGGANKVLTVKVGAGVAETSDVTITCTKILANLGSAQAEVFNLQTTQDTTDKVCAAPYTVNAGTATWTSAARAPLGVAQTNGNLVLKFSTRNSIAADGTFKATASADLFAENGAAKTTCTATCGGTANVVKSSTVATKRSLTVVLTDVCAAATAVVATCTGNLVNPAAAAITFGFVTSSDIVALTTQTGFTTTAATSPIWTSASRSGFLGTTQAPGDLIVKFTPFKEVPADGTVTITPSANIFTADAATTCTATSDGTAAVVKTAGTATVGNVLTVTMTGALAAGKAAVVTCTSNLAVNGAAGTVVGFTFKTSADAGLVSGATGYTVTAVATKAPTKAPTTAGGNKTATVAAASTDGVNAGVAFTALCLAATALRQ
jgi:hypothetical protein